LSSLCGKQKKRKDLHTQEAKLASKEGATPTRKKDMMEGLTVLLKEKDKDKDKDRDKEREQPREKEKEKEKEGEMEAALYANCLLLGLDASVLGPGVGTRAGLFRHSNPRVGEALLHFLLCALRGPYLSSKDFAGVWPIFDAAQSRDFRKVRSHLSFFLLTWDSHSSSCETHTLCLSGLECTKNFDTAQSHNFCKVRSHLLSSSSHGTHIPHHVKHTVSICLVLYALGTFDV
jgi:hypothetical protein